VNKTLKDLSPNTSLGQGSNSLSNDDPNELLANRNTGVAELDEPVNVKSTNNGLLIPLVLFHHLD